MIRVKPQARHDASDSRPLRSMAALAAIPPLTFMYLIITSAGLQVRLLEVKKPAKKAAFEAMLAAGLDSTLTHPFMQAAAAGRERAASGLAQALITYVVALTARQLLDEAALVDLAIKVRSLLAAM